MGGIELLTIGVILICVPSLASARDGLRAAQLLTLSLVSLLAGTVFVVVAITTCAAAAVEDLASPHISGLQNRPFEHIVPALPLMGWLSMATIVAIGVATTKVTATARRRRRSLRGSLVFADVDCVAGVPVAILPTLDDVAVAVPGPTNLVVVSRGIQQRLRPDEYAAVLAHERAHLRLNHHRDLLTARALRRSLWFVPGIGSATDTLHECLEAEAHESAAAEIGHEPNQRAHTLMSGVEHAFARYQRPSRSSREPSGLLLGAYWLGVTVLSSLGLVIAFTWIG